MFTTLALVISFFLVKLLGIFGLVMFFGLPLIISFVCSIDGWLSFEEPRLNRTRGKILMTIAFVLSIPYWNSIHDTDITANMMSAVTRSWDTHLEKDVKSSPVTRTNISTEIRRYELVGWRPPKHFYVDLEDVKTQEVFRQLYVSKHCNIASSLKVGEEYNIKVTKYTRSDSPTVYVEFHDLSQVFC